MIMARNEFLPFLAMVTVQVGYAGMSISSKLAMESGMPPLVLVAYRQLFASLAIAPFAYFIERKTRPKITKQILFQIFLCSLFGASGNQIFYFVGLKNTTPTTTCALNNMLPATTFILAAAFGLEAVRIRKREGQAKIIGTMLCVGGAMLLSFYHGSVIDIPQPRIQWKYVDNAIMNRSSSRNGHHNVFLGTLCVIAGILAMAIWFILQAKLSKSFEAPYTSSALLCCMANIQCLVIAACTNHNISDWSLRSRVRIFSSVYAGIVGSALSICLMSFAIQRKGPLYASIFSPLTLMMVAFLSWALRMEKLYVGTAIGSVLVVMGLYTVIWGKSKEIDQKNRMDKNGAHDQGDKCKEMDQKNGVISNGSQDQEDKSGDSEKQLQLVDLEGKYDDH